MRRSDQRRDAVFVNYQRDVTGRPLEELLGEERRRRRSHGSDAGAVRRRVVTGGDDHALGAVEARPLTRELAEGVDTHREELDDVIAAHAKGWTVDRIAPLDLNVMRTALYEMEFTDTPAEVAIDEEVEIAKEYCGAEAPKFINGILGAVAREREPAK